MIIELAATYDSSPDPTVETLKLKLEGDSRGWWIWNMFKLKLKPTWSSFSFIAT
jgi:hypothetical protein